MIGKTLAHYEILEQIGEGGMGTVYRARDTKLDRDVAIKVLPREMSGDPERVARFQREAKTLASLQHPNIASIYGFDDVGGVRFLAMELVEGEDLSQRIGRGPVPEAEAVEILRKIADALDAAHAMSIVHRDLKPANIKIAPDGEVKVLDFGLARAYTGETGTEGDPTLSPTITAAMTQAGTILGTAAYMSPEQARGRFVDHRSDIWAMGVIFFEMLVGRRLFAGETITDVLAAVITFEPDLSLLPGDLSAASGRVLRRCLQKDPRRRIRSAADAMFEFDESLTDGRAVATGNSLGSRWLPWAVAGLCAVLAGLAFWMPRNESAQRTEVPHRVYDVELWEGSRMSLNPQSIISPDGKWVVASIMDSVGTFAPMLRSLETGKSVALTGEQKGLFYFWSPDSEYLAYGLQGDRYAQGGSLQRLHLPTMYSQPVGDGSLAFSRGGAWSIHGDILFAPNANSGLYLIAANEDQARQITVVDSTLIDGSHRWPKFFPDGRRFIYTLWSNLEEERSRAGGIFVGSLDGGEHRRILRDVSEAVLSRDGHLLFHRGGKLMAVLFDLETAEVVSEPFIVADEVSFTATSGIIGASVSDRGELLLTKFPDETESKLMVGDLDGGPHRPVEGAVAGLYNFALEASGRFYVCEVLGEIGSVQVWIGDLERGTISRLSRFGNDCVGTAFSPDGREVAYILDSGAGAKVYRHDVSGVKDPQLVFESEEEIRLSEISQWTSDGELLITQYSGNRGYVSMQRIDIESGQMTPLLPAEYQQSDPRVSPDGNWLAYCSEESGQSEIFVRSWPDLETKYRVSRDGGIIPDWNSDGTELTFISTASREIRSVSFDAAGDVPRIGMPQRKVQLPAVAKEIRLDHDRGRFFYTAVDVQGPLPPLRLVMGWQQSR